ncbi:MAG TPA: DUF1109 domain-containing protein [Rhizomicrobium sp.]|jgi:hypothetical protein
MRTDDLITHLSTDIRPVRSGAVTRVLLGAAALGILASAFLMLAVLGLRPDVGRAMTSFGMWTKLIYTFAIGAFAFWIVERAGRPGAEMARPASLLALPILAIILLAGLQMALPGANTQEMVVGHSSRVCAFLVIFTAAPILAATFWALRRLAPTRLTQAGAGAGLFAGAMGAFVYCFHCQEAMAPFIAIWYSLGIALTTGIGAALGRFALRW